MNKNYVLNFNQLLFSVLALKVTLQYILNTQIIKDGGIKFNITIRPMHLYGDNTILLNHSYSWGSLFVDCQNAARL